MAKLRLAFKNLLCWLKLGHWLIEYCDECGVKQPLVWWCSDNALWLAVLGETGGVLCPACFNRKAFKLGYFLSWYPKDETQRARGA